MPIGKKISKMALVAVASISIGIINPAFANLTYAQEDSSTSTKKTCPAGSVRARQQVDTYAECNLPIEDANDNLMSTITQIINVIVGMVGIIAVIVIVVGGIFFTTSQGDSAKVTKAKNAVLYGIVGLIVALLAFAIVNFVLSSVFASATADTSAHFRSLIAKITNIC